MTARSIREAGRIYGAIRCEEPGAPRSTRSDQLPESLPSAGDSTEYPCRAGGRSRPFREATVDPTKERTKAGADLRGLLTGRKAGQQYSDNEVGTERRGARAERGTRS